MNPAGNWVGFLNWRQLARHFHLRPMIITRTSIGRFEWKGERGKLSAVAQAVFGVSLDEIESKFGG